MRQYAELLQNVVIAFASFAAPPLFAAPYTARDITDLSPVPQLGWVWDGSTFRDPNSNKPFVRLLALDPDTGDPKTETFATAPDDAVPPPSSKLIILQGVALTALGGVLDVTVMVAPVLVQVPHPRGGYSYARYRIQAGILELDTPVGWISDIPFSSSESGEYDLGAVLQSFLRVESAVVLHVLAAG